MRARQFVVGTAILSLSLTLTLSACSSSSGKPPGPVRFTADRPSALADTAVDLRLTGLSARQRVTLAASVLDQGETAWTSHADFTADASGTVDLATAAPAPGSSYTGVDAMGLIWSISTPPSNPHSSGFSPPLYPSPFTIEITAQADGKQIAATTLTRTWKNDGVTDRKLTLATDKLYGDLFLPAAGAGNHAAVVIFGGSEGGESQKAAAQLLASHGFPALALAYWREPGLPTALQDIPLEYFQSAGKLLAAQPGVDPAHILAIGYSRGTEAALQSAQYFPDVFHGAVLYSPNSDAFGGFPSESGSAWRLGGQPRLGPIPVDHIAGPVYAFAGTADHVWASDPSATAIMTALDAAKDPFPHKKWTYVGAGHLVGTYPYFPTATTGTHPVDGSPVNFGGTVAADEQAQADSWKHLLDLLGSLG